MKTATVSELKKELQNLPPKQLVETAMRLAKYKKENKELLTYLLFEADDEDSFIQGVKDEMDRQFAEINRSHIYYAKKSLRKILRFANKHIKYSGEKRTEVELLMHFCQKMKSSGISYRRDTAMNNLYARQVEKIEKGIEKLHEDLQSDYRDDVRQLKAGIH